MNARSVYFRKFQTCAANNTIDMISSIVGLQIRHMSKIIGFMSIRTNIKQLILEGKCCGRCGRRSTSCISVKWCCRNTNLVRHIEATEIVNGIVSMVIAYLTLNKSRRGKRSTSLRMSNAKKSITVGMGVRARARATRMK